MARTAAKDLSTYTHEGDFTWREAVASGRSVGVLAVLPCREMLHPKGYSRDISNSSSLTYITVQYDKEYILEFIHKKIVLALGFMEGENFNEGGFDKFIEEQKQYSLAENKRDSEQKMNRTAQELATLYGNTPQYWLTTLKQSAANFEPTLGDAPVTAKSANGREKVKVA